MSDTSRLLERSADGATRTATGSHFRRGAPSTREDDGGPPRSCALPTQKICYGLGHVYNDLCAAVWFSYTLFYFQIVLQMRPTTAGALVMIGQVADSLATPSAGWAVDWISTPRVWHLTGTGLVAAGFTTMFSYAPEIPPSSWRALLYYGLLVTAFQIGWAVVQISHLSVITTVARDDRHSASLTSIRYTASVCCNLFVYVITWATLRTQSTAVTQLGPGDFYKFREIVLIITCVGIVSSLIFYCGMNDAKSRTRHRIAKVDERGAQDSHARDGRDNCERAGASYGRSFLRSIVTYQVSIMYMSSRLYTILNLIYMPLYLEERLDAAEVDSIRGAVASVPLTCFVASFLASLAINNRPAAVDDKVVFALGSCVSLAGCVWMALGVAPSRNAADVYGMAAIIGAGSSGTMITSLCLTAAFVNANGFKGGSVYSTVTFTDKLVSGAVVLLIQHMECEDRSLCPNFYQNVLAYASGACVVLGFLTLLTLQCHNPKMKHEN